ncbi:trypsin-like peptidase domain-containing protein [Solimicrobium silvestre]|uniref:Trypsin-like serine proteases typically periplasmic n=1 Tax=Solimicrobium silvestre TaxID=2099400 RepID=A0A2S9H1Y3_9BURK|nr:trypsin-like peptidase domain-containing protein [Solimicrobium silvestre]PRC93994.1 Trypsin-like serine proteases typically periplasmic [Solimicrobium silvestre]
MRRLWLLFAQVATICLALLLIVSTLKPEWVNKFSSFGKSAHLTSSTIPMLEAPINTVAPGSYRDAAKRAMPSVVNIFTTKEVKRAKNPLYNDPLFRRFFGQNPNPPPEKQSSLGSGVIVSANGYVITNNHVVNSADEIDVVLTDGRKAIAKVVGTDPETDLALIKIDLPDLPAITLGHIEKASVGDVVLAIGNPFGVGQTITMGIISALARNHLDINTFENFIQTDAAINPGNSGGALIDTNGNLIGINSAIFSQNGGSLGIGFAIPVSTVKSVMDGIMANGHVIRGWIGVEPQDVTPELAENFGVKENAGTLIAGVIRSGPADRAGVKPGDILVKVNDTQVTDRVAMMNLIAQLPPDQKAKLTFLRKGKTLTLDVLIGTRQPQPVSTTNDDDEDGAK